MPSSTSFLASSSERALEVHHLTGPVETPLIFDIDLDVKNGETLLVLGPIQSGKSMLMRHLVGLELATSGTIGIDGSSFDPTKPGEKALRRLRSRVGVIFEGSALLRRISVIENVELPLLEHERLSRSRARQTARELLAEVGIEVDDDTVPVQMGRAGQRRVALARALALRPRLLLLDEPTLGLDSQAAHEFDETVQGLQKRHNFGIVIFSHQIRYAYAPVTEIDILVGGRIIARGSRESLLESEDPVIHGLLHRREREQ